MIKRIFSIILCFNIIGCTVASFRSGLKFDKSVAFRTNAGNPSATKDVLKLKNNDFISFYRPMGECGAGVTFFIFYIVPIPVWFHTNTCNNKLLISSNSEEIVNLQLKYNGKIYEAIEKKISNIGSFSFKLEGKNVSYVFEIDNLSEFKLIENKILIVTTKDGLVQELPVKWGVMNCNNWSIID